MTKRKIYIIIGIIIIGIGIYKYVFPNHRDIKTEASAFVLSSNQLAAEFISNASASENKYLNKTIEVTGVTTDVAYTHITLNDKVFCQFLKKITPVSINEYIKIKGRVIGYDDLLGQVKLDQCHIIN